MTTKTNASTTDPTTTTITLGGLRVVTTTDLDRAGRMHRRGVTRHFRPGLLVSAGSRPAGK